MFSLIQGRRGETSAPPLADQYLKCTSRACRTFHPAARPFGARAGDMFLVSPVSDAAPLAATGIRTGDSLICLVTSDVRAGDLAVARSRGRVTAGFLEFESDGRIVLADTHGEPLDYYLDAGEVIGRTVEVQRAGRRVPLGVALRPPHP